MKSLGCFSLGLFILFAMPASELRAQSPSPPEASKAEAAPEKGLRNLVFEAKHRDVADLRPRCESWAVVFAAPLFRSVGSSEPSRCAIFPRTWPRSKPR